MKVFHTFFCFLFIALQDGNIVFVNADGGIHTVMEGEDVTVECTFPFRERRKYLCKKNCEEGNILMTTREDTAENGRYSIRYEHNSVESDSVMYVSIKQLKKSDSGWYRCALGRYWYLEPYCDFQVVVTEASATSQPKSTLPTFPPSTFLPSSSTESSEQLDSSPPRSDQQLYMGLILVFKIFILSMPLMIFCKKRRSTKPKVPPVETIYINVSESSRVIEEIREDRQISSPPVETSSLYCNAKYIKPNRAEDT
ncbi:uncharacterized protein LOC110960721 isoform X2 [Acanthochromis polyacanthus]|uniref:uncharacterized protein LOC110960721 isoform X2 n=1 Tax=Acanthochromis polyacanthus TaxID=80966 RepID=UPI0022343C1B|nr:uncharacterized protein LOC110960721 isoform X2 [Acanthochromis polyacanthus]